MRAVTSLPITPLIISRLERIETLADTRRLDACTHRRALQVFLIALLVFGDVHHESALVLVDAIDDINDL